MISEVYDALLAAAAPEDKASKAAEAIAAYEIRFAKIKNDIPAFRAEVRGEFNLVTVGRTDVELTTPACSGFSYHDDRRHDPLYHFHRLYCTPLSSAGVTVKENIGGERVGIYVALN